MAHAWWRDCAYELFDRLNKENDALKAEVERLREHPCRDGAGYGCRVETPTSSPCAACAAEERAEKAEALLVPCGKCGTRRVTCDCYGSEALLAKCAEALGTLTYLGDDYFGHVRDGIADKALRNARVALRAVKGEKP